eukprot:gene6171-7879_t
MDTGCELAQTVATFIVQKIILDESGLTDICSTAEKFHSLSETLSRMVGKLLEKPSARLL